MQIRELAAAADTPVDTVRHYERTGLLPRPSRRSNNYRQYGPADVRRLQFIRNCRALDMSLEEIRELLPFVDNSEADCAPVDRVVEQHLAHVRSRLKALRALERQLKGLLARHAHATDDAECSIVRELATPGGGRRPGRGVHTS
jgi:DNA-binding transcriptional MerR regulator